LAILLCDMETGLIKRNFLGCMVLFSDIMERGGGDLIVVGGVSILTLTLIQEKQVVMDVLLMD
jgi:hypothetical protein